MSRYSHLGAEETHVALQASVDAAGFVFEALDENGELYKELPPGRRAPISRTVQQIVDYLIDPAFQRHVSEEGLKQRTQIALDTFRVITLGDSRRLQSVIDALEPVLPKDPGSVDLEEAEARGRLRLQAMYRKILADSYSVAELLEALNVSRQRLAQLRTADQLFAIAVPYHKGMLYPRWQFGEDNRPRPIMRTLISEAKQAGLDAIGLHQLMSNPASGDGISPVQLLAQGQEELVLGIIQGSNP